MPEVSLLSKQLFKGINKDLLASSVHLECALITASMLTQGRGSHTCNIFSVLPSNIFVYKWFLVLFSLKGSVFHQFCCWILFFRLFSTCYAQNFRFLRWTLLSKFNLKIGILKLYILPLALALYHVSSSCP